MFTEHLLGAWRCLKCFLCGLSQITQAYESTHFIEEETEAQRHRVA